MQANNQPNQNIQVNQSKWAVATGLTAAHVACDVHVDAHIPMRT